MRGYYGRKCPAIKTLSWGNVHCNNHTHGVASGRRQRSVFVNNEAIHEGHQWCGRHDHTVGGAAIAGTEEEELRQRFYNWHLANLEFANAASIEDLSVRTWDQDDPHELSGPHCFLPGQPPHLHFLVSQYSRTWESGTPKKQLDSSI
jgi:hypothetical protein